MKIAINKDTQDPSQSGRLIVELTIDGAKELEEKGFIEDMDTEYYHFSPDFLTIFTTAKIDWESPQEQTIATFDAKDSINIIEEWKFNPKQLFYFYPDKDNDGRFKEVSSKIAATAWAIHSQEKVSETAINVNERHVLIALAYGKVEEIMHAFKYDQYKQDDKYYTILKDLSAEMDKELDFLQAKMKLMNIISGNNFNKENIISELYREFREAKQ